jgi:hypothetical protein
MASKNDYLSLERQYERGTMSLRQLCRDNGIKTWSAVTEYAKRNAWEEKRRVFQEKLHDNEVKAIIDKRVEELSKALDDAITISSRALWAFYDSLTGRWVTDPESDARVFLPPQTIPPADFVKIMEKLMVLNGQVTNREAHLSMELGPGQLTMEMLHDLARVARDAGADSGPSADSPLPRLEGARSVN